jgi:hypothetical protein
VTQDPISLALREISETKRLLEALIVSSESFDYFKAKAALAQLSDKVRDLGKLQTELSAQQPLFSERLVPFPATTVRPEHS